MLSPTQMFLKLLFLFAVLEVILFAGVVYFYEMSTGEIAGLGVAAVVMFMIFAIRTWSNPELHRD